MHKQSLFYIPETKSKVKPKALINGLAPVYSSNVIDNHLLHKDDLFRCSRVLLCFARLTGIVPISGLFRGKLNDVRFRRCSLGSLTSISIILIMLVNQTISVLAFLQAPAKDASNIARNAAGSVCYGIGIFVYIFMYKNSGKLIGAYHKWRDLRTTFYKEDSHLFRSITLISGIIYTSAILENLVSHYSYFKGVFFPNNASHRSVWETYFVKSHSQYVTVVPYNIVLAIGIFICNKCAVYAWNFGDIIVTVFARATFKRFQLHFEDLKEKLGYNSLLLHDPSIWNQAVVDHERLVELVDEFNHLLSPLVFVCTATNIYFICLTLNSFLVPTDQDLVNNVYAAWAFVHLLVRTFTAFFYCSKVNVYAHKIEQLLTKCPVTALTKDVERAEFNLRTSKIGFEGLGCFTITKPFILAVFNVIFTFEIVLLQSSAVTPPVESTG